MGDHDPEKLKAALAKASEDLSAYFWPEEVAEADQTAYLLLRLGQEEAETNKVVRLVQRIRPVCRNCIHAGGAVQSGNPAKGWVSCRKNAPVAGSTQQIGYEMSQLGPRADFPNMRHDDVCGDFSLVPLKRELAAELERCEPNPSYRLVIANLEETTNGNG